MEPYGEVEEQYVEFAAHAERESRVLLGVGATASPTTRRSSTGSPSCPDLKRQPNLVFAAARWHGVPAPGPYAGLRDALLADDGSIRATIMARATQTNEVGRLATLVPAFALLADGRPLSLVEAGASAGLCLYPDRWGYRWETADGVVSVGAGAAAGVRGPRPGAAAGLGPGGLRGGSAST